MIALRAAVLAAITVCYSAPSHALVINAAFDSSVTSLANASKVEQAFTQAENNIDRLFTNAATVNLNVSWGSVAGQAIPSGALGASILSLYGYYSYPSIVSLLKRSGTSAADQSAYASLPATAPAGQSRYVITAAQGKALGVIAPTGGTDGSIGFGTGVAYSYDQASVAPGTYDFVSVAEHEITEVMGRISGLNGAGASYATPFDLFRYAGTGVRSFDANASAYFSIDGGQTDLVDFNHGSGGDRGDYLSTSSTNDTADAFTYPGTAGVLSTLDQTVLDVIGWGSSGTGSGGSSIVATQQGLGMAAVPEPASLAVLAVGMAVVGLRRRART